MMERKLFTVASKKVSALLLAACLTVGMIPVTASEANAAEVGEIKEFTITKNPTKIKYPLGATSGLDYTGGVFSVALYDSVNHYDVTENNDLAAAVSKGTVVADASKVDFTKAGEYDVTLRYKSTPKDSAKTFEKTTTYKVNVVDYNTSLGFSGDGFSEIASDGRTAKINLYRGNELKLTNCNVVYNNKSGASSTVAISSENLSGTYNKDKVGTYDLSLKCEYNYLDSNGNIVSAPQTLTLKVNVIEFNYKLDLMYKAHVQYTGWMGWMDEDGVAGTTGLARRMEALMITTTVRDKDGNTVASTDAVAKNAIQYQAHIQRYGWEEKWTSSTSANKYCGTVGESLRMEAVRIKLNDILANNYNIYYRVHVQNIGWTNWVKDGADAGTTGKSLRVEAIRIKLEPKNE